MYASDLTNEELVLIKHYFDPVNNRGAAGSIHAKHDIVNAIFYLNKTGAQWRQLPNEPQPWQTAYDHYSQWHSRGVWKKR